MSIEEITNAVRQVVREELAAAPVRKEFAPFEYLNARFSISQSTLNRLVKEGVVGMRKTGDARQCQALFNVAHVEAWFEPARTKKGGEA